MLRRAWQLYVAHVFLFVIFIAEVSYTVTTFNNPMYNEEMRVADFLDEPHVAVIQALLLQFQPTFLDILPLYILMLVIFPVVLIGMQRHPLLVLLPSAALYIVVQISGIVVPAYPEGHVWYFNPLAWQFLFVSAALLGHARIRGQTRLPFARVLYPAAAVIFAAAFLIKLSWTIHGVWDAFPGLLLKQLWPINKNNLSPLRLVPFYALVVLVALRVPREAQFLQSTAARPLVLCGQQSLEIFCLGIILSVLAHFILTEYGGGVWMQLAANAAGITVMFLTAAMLAEFVNRRVTAAASPEKNSAPPACPESSAGARRLLPPAAPILNVAGQTTSGRRAKDENGFFVCRSAPGVFRLSPATRDGTVSKPDPPKR